MKRIQSVLYINTPHYYPLSRDNVFARGLNGEHKTVCCSLRTEDSQVIVRVFFMRDVVRFYTKPLKDRLHYDNNSKREINGDVAVIVKDRSSLQNNITSSSTW